MSSDDASPYINGNYAPVSKEVTVSDLSIVGSIPVELQGLYVRNGPNPSTTSDVANHHWFLGHGMVHGVRLFDGEAKWFRNRYVSSSEGFGPNTNVIAHAGQTLAIVEGGPMPIRLDHNLESLGSTNLGGLPSGFSAHPKVDPLTGELHALCYHWPDQVDKVHYVVVSPGGNVTRSVPIHTPTMPMIHDMALTQTYAAVFDLPVSVDVNLAMNGNPFPFTWQNGYDARVGLLPRTATDQDEIIWCEIDPCFAFHPMNSYDSDDGKVVIDICEYDRIFDTDLNGPFRDSRPRLARWIVDPNRRSVKRETLDTDVQEFPRINDAVANLPYRYGYLSGGVTNEVDWFGTTIKHDLHLGTKQVREHGHGRQPGEAVFIARQGATAEDDGWLMMYVYDPGRDGSDLVILDASDITTSEIARIELPQRVPNGFHGNWLPQ